MGIAPNVDIAQEAQKIRNALIELADLKIDKWIIDLRYNGGGNMQDKCILAAKEWLKGKR